MPKFKEGGFFSSNKWICEVCKKEYPTTEANDKGWIDVITCEDKHRSPKAYGLKKSKVSLNNEESREEKHKEDLNGIIEKLQEHLRLTKFNDKFWHLSMGLAEIAGIGDEEAIDPLIAIYRICIDEEEYGWQDSGDEDLQCLIIETLAEIGNSRAVITFIEASKSEHPDGTPIWTEIRKAAKKGLQKMSPSAVGIELEKHEMYDEANKWYKSKGMLKEAAKIRKQKAEQGAVKVTQKIVQGDEVTKTEVKDSVINRSNVGGGSTKMQELKELKEMFDSGFISKEDMEKMKKEILGK